MTLLIAYFVDTINPLIIWIFACGLIRGEDFFKGGLKMFLVVDYIPFEIALPMSYSLMLQI